MKICEIGSREVILKYDETKSIDWAEAFAKTITNGNAEDYLVRNGLYK